MFKACITLPADFDSDSVALISEGLAEEGQPFSFLRPDDHAQWTLDWLYSESPDVEDLNTRFDLLVAAHSFELESSIEWFVEEVPDINWLEHCYKQFPPFSVGPFFVYGSHYEDGAPDGQIGLQIDAATAFGSGEHGTTKGCLQAMLDLKGQGACPWNVLDMGTGSGILAIAAWKLWKTPILAVDNDEEAVRVAERHQESNKVPAGGTDMSCICGDGFATPLVKERAPYDLIIANILASALKEMAESLIDVVDDNGFVILSGILNEQVQSVLDVYEPLGLRLKKTIEIGDWSTLLLQKASA